MFLPVLAGLVAGAAASPSLSASTGEAPWVSLSGSGLLTLPDTTTLAPGHWNVDFGLDNQDRDPIRLDVLDFQGAWTYGIRPRLETYGHFVLSRAVAVGDRAVLFPPPLDIIIPAGASAPHRPYYTLCDAFPYVSQSGTSQLGKLIPGDGVVGGKWRLKTPRDLRPGLAVTAELKFPLTRDLSNLQSGSGTGGFDQTVRMIAEWRRRRESLVAGVGLTHVGRPPFGDRLIAFRPGALGDVTDLPLRLANHVSLGLGLRHVLNKHAALVAEATKIAAVGGHSSAFEAAGPFDVSAGGQLRWGRAHLTLALRYHANSNPHQSAAYPSPLGGLADMTAVDEADLERYLAAIGAAGAVPHLRDRSHIALAFPTAGPPLPEGARILPPAYPRHAHDQIGYMLVSGWTFGRSRRPSVPRPP